MKEIIGSFLVAIPIAIVIQQAPSKPDGTSITMPNCNASTEKMHWDGDSFECVADATGGGSGSSVPTGSILLIDSGSCPADYTEASSFNGKFLLGTIASNGDIGGTGGTDNVTPTGSFTGSSATTNGVSGGTPSGTISTPTFTGSALANHAHELPFQLVSGTSIRHLSSATFGTGTSRAAQGGVTATANTTSAATALSQSVSAGTPAGTISTPTFTGSALGTHSHTLTATGNITINQLDNRPAFAKVIFCKKN